MMEAIINCMSYLFGNGFENIIYSYDENNIKSKRFCEKMGFKLYDKFIEGNFNGGESMIYRCIVSKEYFYKMQGTMSNKI